MKKIYSLLTVVCLLFMVGCSDDDDNNNKFEKVYKAEDVTLSGYNVGGVTAKFVTDDLKNGTVTLTNLLPGEKETEITVTVTEDATSSGTYAIEGTSKKDGTREISVKGNAGDKLTLTTTFKSLSPAVGNWKPMPASEPIFTLNLKITPENGTDMIDMCGILGINEIPLSAIPNDFHFVIGNAINKVFTEMVDFNVNLENTGSLIAGWKPLGNATFKEGTSGDDVVTFNQVDKQLFFRINFANIGGTDAQRRDTGGNSIEDILGGLLITGLPLNLVENEATGITVSVTKEMMTPFINNELLMALAMEYLNSLEINNLALIGMGITKENIQEFVPKLITAINSCKEFTIEINMQPVA